MTLWTYSMTLWTYNKHLSASPLRNAKPKLTLPGSFVRDIIPQDLQDASGGILDRFPFERNVQTIRNRKSKCWSKLLSKKSVNFFSLL